MIMEILWKPPIIHRMVLSILKVLLRNCIVKIIDGYVRPDHGRHLWGEVCRPGYGLYDRALGIMYLLGLWDGYETKKKGGVL